MRIPSLSTSLKHSQFWHNLLDLNRSNRLQNDTLVQEDEITLNCTYSSHNINDGNFLFGMVLVLFSGLFSNQSPQFVQIDGWHVVLVFPDMEVPHTNL